MAVHGFGIIGLGMISEFHAQAIMHIDNASLVAGYDPVKERADAFSKKYNCKGYTDLDEFLRDPNVEICCIATPSGLHLDGAVAAARKGKHVIVEKPLEITPERCRAIIEECKKNSVMLSGIFPSRYHEVSKLLKRAIDEGRFGKITFADAQIKWYRSQEYYDSGAWRGTWEMDGGGCLMNQGIHAIDLLQWLVGRVKEVSAFITTEGHERIEVEDNAAVILRFENGAIGTIEGSTCAYPGFLKRIEVMGTNGSAIIEEEDLVAWKFKDEREEDEEIRKRFRGKTVSGGGASDPSFISYEPHQRLFEAFIKALESDTDPDITGESASKAVEIISAAYESARTDSIIRL